MSSPSGLDQGGGGGGGCGEPKETAGRALAAEGRVQDRDREEAEGRDKSSARVSAARRQAGQPEPGQAGGVSGPSFSSCKSKSPGRVARGPPLESGGHDDQQASTSMTIG